MPAAAGSVAGSIRGPATTIMRRPGTSAFPSSKLAIDAPQQRAADPGAADGDQADLLARGVAELVAQPLAVGELGGIEARDIAREAEVRSGPVPDRGQAGAEVRPHHVGLVADEDGTVAHAREARDLLEHLGVVVGGQLVLALGAVDTAASRRSP